MWLSFILCTLFICGRFSCLKSQTRAAATMSVTAAASGFVVLLLTVTGTVPLHSCCHSILHSDFWFTWSEFEKERKNINEPFIHFQITTCKVMQKENIWRNYHQYYFVSLFRSFYRLELKILQSLKHVIINNINIINIIIIIIIIIMTEFLSSRCRTCHQCVESLVEMLWNAAHGNVFLFYRK